MSRQNKRCSYTEKIKFLAARKIFLPKKNLTIVAVKSCSIFTKKNTCYADFYDHIL